MIQPPLSPVRRTGAVALLSLAVHACAASAQEDRPQAALPMTPACEFPSSAQIIPLEAGDGGSPVIRGSFNGGEAFAMVLDNGAGGTSITPALAEALALPVAREVESAGGLGGAIAVKVYRVDRAVFGPLSLENAEIAAFDGPVFDSHRIAGLAGVDLFAGRVIWWNLKTPVAAVTSSDQIPGEGSCWRLVESQWVRPWRVMVPVEIDGVAGMAMLDTGAQRSVINPAYAAALGAETAIQDGEIAGVDGRAIPLMRVTARSASIGPWSWRAPPLQTGELALFDRMGPNTERFMLLGMDWMQGRSFVQDYARQKVWLAEQPVER